MARLFKQTYSKRLPDGTRKHTTGTAWIAEFRGADGIVRRRSTKTGDKSAAQQLAADWERTDRRNAAYGINANLAEHAQRTLADHVSDWHRALMDNGATQAYADLSKKRVQSILNAIKATRFVDIDANKVVAHLAQRRRKKLSIESSNHYTRRIKQFGAWMVRSGRATSSQLGMLTLLNSRPDRRHARRALSTDELNRLIHTARNGPPRFGVAGPERALLYLTAVETGLRANELRTLTVGSFKFNADPPTVTVGAAYSKHRREDVLPIRSELAASIRSQSAGKLPGAAALQMPSASNVSRMLRADLEAARLAWILEAENEDTEKARREGDASFLLSRDESGQVVDFHALRHTFISNLARGGVHPKVAQTLARHSSITLTMDRYSHTVLGDLHDALDVLPDLRANPAQEARQRATGTHGRAFGGTTVQAPHNPQRMNPTASVESVASCVAFPVAFTGDSPDKCLSSIGIESAVCGDSRGRENHPVNMGDSDTSWHRGGPEDTAKNELGALGLEPRTHGLKGRDQSDVTSEQISASELTAPSVASGVAFPKEIDPELAFVISRWPIIPQANRAGIVAIARAGDGTPEEGR